MSLEHNGVAVPNFGLLGHSVIDESDDPDSVGGNLVCRTDNTSCCRGGDNPNGGGFGDWFYPSGNVVVFSEETQPNGQLYRMLRSMQIVRLHRVENSAATANGIYHCEVADQNGVMQTRYVGLYTNGAGRHVHREYLWQILRTKHTVKKLPPLISNALCMSKGDLGYLWQILRTKHTVKTLLPLISNALCMSKGAVTAGASLQFALIDPGSFRLFAFTSGGPPTTFSWRGPNGVLSNADSTVTVQNGRTSIVQLELRVTGNVPGEYTFAATNSRTTGDVTSTLTVTGTHTHTHTHTHTQPFCLYNTASMQLVPCRLA